ncbi:MAG: hypothetical protein ACXWUL_04905, partial [Caldimonas sp.]
MNPTRTARPAAVVTALATFAAALALAACDKPATAPAAPGVTAPPATPAAKVPTAPAAGTQAAAPENADAGIAWRQAASDAEIDAAFAAAKSENKPVFVYWGAK